MDEVLSKTPQPSFIPQTMTLYIALNSLFLVLQLSKVVQFLLCCILKVLVINRFVSAVCLLFMSRCSSNK